MTKNKSRISFIVLPIIFLLVFACAFSLRAHDDVQAHAEVTSLVGDGTQAIPKHITTVDEFIFFMNKVNDPEASDEYLTYYYDLEVDLNLSGKAVVPIGSEARPFNGDFHGNGHVISGYTLSATTNNVGLFGYTGENASIYELGMVGANITAESANVGGIVGYNQGNVYGCFYQGNITARQNVGGIAGINKGSISQSFTNGELSASASEANVGGLVGQNHAKLQYSYSIAKITTSNKNATNFGGIIGGRYTSQVESTPSGTFFNLSANPGVDAIGYGANSIDKSAVSLDSSRTQALTRVEFNSLDGQKLFGNNLGWERNAFEETNHSAYVAPLQTIFANRVTKGNETKALIRSLETATSERMYGIATDVEADWGTIENPYLIFSETHLFNLQRAVSEYGEAYFQKYFKQSANIRLASRFYPIGNRQANNMFQGHYDGGNKKISNLEIKETITDTEYLGLFGYIGPDATICNLTLDDTCSVSGTQGIGSIVGFNQGGTISNVESRATVSAQGKSGGIVGITREGKYYDVLSAVTLKLRGSNNGGLYGVIGGYLDKSYSEMANVWYFVDKNSSFTSTNGMGKVLIADSSLGIVTATKNVTDLTINVLDNDGTVVPETVKVVSMVFETTSNTTPFALEFRNSVEYVYQEAKSSGGGLENATLKVVSLPKQNEQGVAYRYPSVAGVEILPEGYNDDAELDASVYARFVKKVSYSIKNNENAQKVAEIAFLDAYNVKTDRLYDGQTFTLSIKILDGAYLKGLLAQKSEGGIIELKLIDSNGGKTEPTFSYNNNGGAVEYRATMHSSIEDVDNVELGIVKNSYLENLEAEIALISWSEEDFKKDHVFTGDPITFPIEKLETNKPNNYSIVVNYSGGSAPINANQTPTENYSFTVIYQNANGVRMGSKNGLIHIDKRQLLINNSMLPNSKEWDNSSAPVVVSVDNTILYYEIEGNTINVAERFVVLVNASMTFNANPSDKPTSNIGVAYSFALSGKDANNFIAPADTSRADGIINKRHVTVKLTSYEGVFAGADKKPSLENIGFIYSGVINSKPLNEIYTFLNENGENVYSGIAKDYRLKVSLPEESAYYYEIEFLNGQTATDVNGDTYSYVNFTVKPFESNMEYYIDAVALDGIVYDGSAHVVSASFKDVTGKSYKVDSFVITNENGDEVTELTNAGVYTISTTFSDTNYKLNGMVKEIVVEKANQVDIQFISSSIHDFGTAYTAEVEGGSGVGVVTFKVGDDCTDMASFEGNVLTIYKAGDITLIATRKEESGNYNDVSTEFILTVNKTEIEIGIQDFEVNFMDDVNFNFIASNGETLLGVAGVDVLLNGDVYTGQRLNAGSYDISLVLDEGANSDGYILKAGQCGTLLVKKLAITVTAEDKMGIYGEELKELTYTISDSRVEALNGELSTYARNVGDSDIIEGTITNENNPNFEITFVKATYSITPKDIVVKVVAQEKKYSEADPEPKFDVEGLEFDDTVSSIGLNVKLTRFAGEDSYVEGVDAYASYQYRLQEDITMTSANYNVSFETASLTIVPGIPELVSKKAVEIAPGVALDATNKPTVRVAGKIYEASMWVKEELGGSVAWKETATPNFEKSPTQIYVAIFTPTNKNFAPLEVEIEVKVIPIEVTVKFLSSKEIVYDGYNHDEIEYELVGLISGQEANEDVTFSGDVKNVGKFTAKITLNNCIYKLSGSGEITIKIKEADLEVIVEDAVIIEGETPKIEFIYSGFQKGDTEDKVTTKPIVTLPSTPGTYTLTPFGAECANYNITYKSFTFKVLTKNIKDKANGLSLEGAFDSETKFEMVEAMSNVEVSNKYEEVREGYKALENMGIDKVYDLKYSVDGEVISVEGEVYLTMDIPEGYEDTTKLAYAVLTNDGEVLYIQDVLYSDDKVTINISNAKALLILAEEEDNSLMIYLAIGAVVVVIIVFALIIRAVKKRREARYIVYND